MGAKKLKSDSLKKVKGGYPSKECGRSGNCSWVAHNTRTGSTTYGPVRNNRGQIVSDRIFTVSRGSSSNSGSGVNRSRSGKGTSA